MINGAIILLFSAIVSVVTVILLFGIFTKVYQENYKKPWIFIALSSIFLAASQLFRFVHEFFDYVIINVDVMLYIDYILGFLSISLLAYGLLLETFILKYYKGKFVKMKLIPVQEGTLGGEIDLNVSNGSSYLAIKKDPKYLKEEFSEATRKGFEGFLITEQSPREIRLKLGLVKTPIAWIHQNNENKDMTYYKQNFLDEASEMVDPLQLNKIISFADNFLEASQNPFLLIDLNQILRVNNFSIVLEFLNYISKRSEKYNGILICTINEDLIKDFQIAELKEFLKELE